MDDLSRLLENDIQSSLPEVPLGLSRAGVTGVSKAIRIRYGDHEKQIAADIECTVDLDPAQKRVHMSRLPELLDEAIEQAVVRQSFLVQEPPAYIPSHVD